MRGERAEGKGEREEEKGGRVGKTREHYGKTVLAFLKEKDVGNGNLDLRVCSRGESGGREEDLQDPSLALKCCTVFAVCKTGKELLTYSEPGTF